jgi:hypothetical protein
MAVSVLLVFLHGGVLAAPLNYNQSQHHHVIVVNTTSASLEEGGANSGTLVNVDIAPHGPLEFADFAVVQQASVQSFFEAGGSFLESVTGFFHRLASRFSQSPPQDPQAAPV